MSSKLILFIRWHWIDNNDQKDHLYKSSFIVLNFNSESDSESKRIEYILERNLIEKSVKRPFCCTVSILQVYFTYFCYNLLGPGISFYRKSKINIERKPNYEIDWFHNWPSIISHALYAFHFTNDDFPL